MNEEGLTETKHKKIFIGKPGEFEFDDIEKKINELLNIAISGNEQKLREKLKEYVPTYKEPEEVNSKVS